MVAPRPLLELFPPTAGRLHTRPAVAAVAAPPVTLTYEPFYGFAEKPFGVSVDPRFIYHSTSFDHVVQELIDALGRGEPIVVLTGETGTGKTTLCRSLVEQLGSHAVTAFLTNPVASVDDLLKTALVDFGVVAREETTRGRLAAATHQELATAVGDFAASLSPRQASAVIVLDEAHNLPPSVLEPLAALADVEGGDRRVQLILVGPPTFPALLHRPAFRGVERRVAVRSRLEPLTAEETIGYVLHRVAAAGGNSRVEFDEAAMARLHQLTGGVPRLINLVCDRALTHGHELSAGLIDEALIASAANELGLAPLPTARRWITRIAPVITMAVGFVLLMLAGAGAAAWVFQDAVSRLLAQW